MLVLKRLNLHHPDQNQIIKINPNNNYVYFGRLPYKYFLKTADQKKMPGLPNCQFIQVDHVDVSRIHVRLEIRCSSDCKNSSKNNSTNNSINISNSKNNGNLNSSNTTFNTSVEKQQTFHLIDSNNVNGTQVVRIDHFKNENGLQQLLNSDKADICWHIQNSEWEIAINDIIRIAPKIEVHPHPMTYQLATYDSLNEEEKSRVVETGLNFKHEIPETIPKSPEVKVQKHPILKNNGLKIVEKKISRKNPHPSNPHIPKKNGNYRIPLPRRAKN